MEYKENRFISAREDLGEELIKSNRSLVLVGPIDIQKILVYTEDGKAKSRISFLNTYFRCTDFKFNRFCQNLLNKENQRSIALDSGQLKKILKVDELFFVVGLSRKWTNSSGVTKCWPMVVGVHTIPTYSEIIGAP